MGLEDLKTNLELWNTPDFGADFVWGMSSAVANSSNYEDKTTFSLESNQNSTINDAYYYKKELKKYQQDIAFLKQTGILNFRFSLSWSRILPDGIGKINTNAIIFYHQLLDHCKENGVEPFVTLYDSCLPVALQDKGGWSNRQMLRWFENYTSLCAKEFKAKVNYWIIFNEPSLFTGASNFFDIYPPGKNRINLFQSAVQHCLLSQAIAFKQLKKIIPTAEVGTFFICNYCIPITHSEKDIKATERIDAFLNRLFIEPTLGLGYPITTLPFLKNISKYMMAGDDDLLQIDFDFIGLQNCSSEIVAHNPFIPYLNAKIVDYDKLRVKKNYLEHDNYQELMYQIVKKYSKYKGVKKIFINETLAPIPEDDEDVNAAAAIKKTYTIQTFLQQLLIANQNGGKVNGYFITTV